MNDEELNQLDTTPWWLGLVIGVFFNPVTLLGAAVALNQWMRGGL